MMLCPHLCVFWILSAGISALPYSEDNGTYLLPQPQRLQSRALDNLQLRIMVLGASISMGWRSTDKNGFRYALRNQLIADGAKVNFVGSQQTGNMQDNEHEGWPGTFIDDAYGHADLTIPDKPNLVIIQVGSNDISQNRDVNNAHNRLARVVDHLFDSIPRVTVIVSTMLPRNDGYDAGDVENMRRNGVYNAGIIQMVKARQALGRKLNYADHSSSFFNFGDLAEGLHPNDSGYKKMAAVYYEVIKGADKAGWLVPPAAVAGVNDNVANVPYSSTCEKIPGNVLGPYWTQQGSGRNDGNYIHSAVPASTINGFNNPTGTTFNNPFSEGVYWADINGDGVDDYVYIASTLGNGIGVALNKGNGDLAEYLYIPLTLSCDRAGVRFADMTGDGRDDLCCIASNGDLIVWENTIGTDARSPKWVSLGILRRGMCPRARVRLADIDGDGRADYVCFDENLTKIIGWRNGANRNGPTAYWTPLRGVFNGLAERTLSGYEFVDLNGDHRDDLVWVNPNGQVTTWINQRASELGFTPSWLPMGVTHGGASSPRNITFGAFMGTGRADYSVVYTVPGANVKIERIQNMGSGGTALKGDGVRYCDMTGDGRDDYIWVSLMGEMTLFGNNGRLDASWDQWLVIYDAKRTRREIYFADFDGDGRCDILMVNKQTGATTMLRNDFDGKTFKFTNLGVVTGSATCTLGYGYDLRDTSVRWHDLDGDGRADFLCMEQDGRVTGYLNKGIGVMENQGQIKMREGRERRNLRFADVNGDGRDDLLWVDGATGEVHAYKNEGKINPGMESAFTWYYQGMITYGHYYRGSAIEFMNYNGLGRADYLFVGPHSNTARVLLNICPGGIGPAPPSLPAGAPAAPPITGGVDSGGPPRPDYNPDDGEDDTLQPCPLTFTTLQALSTTQLPIPPWCGPQYILDVLQASVISALERETEILGDGYDKYFKIYADYVVDSSTESLQKFMRTRGNEFFKCAITEQRACCTNCAFYKVPCSNCVPAGQCRPLINSGDNGFMWENVTQNCPPDMSLRGVGDNSESSGKTIYWTLQEEKKDEFWAELTSTIGAPVNKLPISPAQRLPPPWSFSSVCAQQLICTAAQNANGQCPYKGVWKDHVDASCYYSGWWHNAPVVSNFEAGDVVNPKDVLSSALDAIRALIPLLAATAFEVRSGMYAGDPTDLVDAASMPIFMIEESLEQMETVVEMAKTISAANKEALILNFLSAVFFIIPALGQSLAGMGLVALGRTFVFGGELANVIIGIYGVAGQPETTPLFLFGLFLSIRGVRDVYKIKSAANIYRSIKAGDLSKISPSMAGKLDIVTKYTSTKVTTCGLR